MQTPGSAVVHITASVEYQLRSWSWLGSRVKNIANRMIAVMIPLVTFSCVFQIYVGRTGYCLHASCHQREHQSNLLVPRHLQLPDDWYWQNEHSHVRDNIRKADPSIYTLFIDAMTSLDVLIPIVRERPAHGKRNYRRYEGSHNWHHSNDVGCISIKFRGKNSKVQGQYSQFWQADCWNIGEDHRQFQLKMVRDGFG